MAQAKTGFQITPYFVCPRGNPYHGLEFVKHPVSGFESMVEAPKAWSSTAVSIVASKYFRHEQSVQDLIDRVVDTIERAAIKQKYFNSKISARIFANELKFLCVQQMASFNSPVWFNCGVFERPQTSACFILNVEDDLSRIFDLIKTEAQVFKYGSGVGANFSPLRSRFENLSHGGKSSGLMTFLDVFDRAAGAVKSGGTTRRAAKMVCLDVDHPEIIEFVRWKAHEERKARVLLEGGFSGGMDGEAYRSVSGQNSNNSVRVSDQFLSAVKAGRSWWTRSRISGKKLKEFSALELWQEITEAAWSSADPGLQFHDTINSWHTCPASGKINASNPCSEYMFLDNSACNLASLNLVKFLSPLGEFNVSAFQQAVRVLFCAQEILVGMSSYPTPEIEAHSLEFRPLGLGFSNLGGLLLRLGLPYDSEEARAWAAALTALMAGTAYKTSAELAQKFGAFRGFKKNRISMLKVIKRHSSATKKIPPLAPLELRLAAQRSWAEALKLGEKSGFRNAQATALAPTGTISFMMDCDTTGIEPEYALVKTKSLTGGGYLRLVNGLVRAALLKLKYSEQQIESILEEFKSKPIEKTSIKPEHWSVFDCAQSLVPGGRHLSVEAHLTMMAAVQPFLSGAISKTVNLPAEATVEQVSQVYWRAWELGLKSIALYRDSSKSVQPLVASCHICG